MRCSGCTVLKANFRSITGYPGKADVRLALLRNEINLDLQATPIFEQSVRPSVKDGQAIPLFAQGFMDGDKLTRDPAAPDVPSVGEAYRAIHGVDPSGPAWDSYKAVARAIGNGGKILMIHSDAPAEARAAIKRADRGDGQGSRLSEDRRERARRLWLQHRRAARSATSPPSAGWTRHRSPGCRNCSAAISG